MTVNGYNVPQAVLDGLVRRLQRGPASLGQLAFHAYDQLGVPRECADRLVDRWLQAHRKSGGIRFCRPNWHWVGYENANGDKQ